MSALQQRAEVQRLARLLGTDHAKLDYLEALDRATLKQLREQTTAMLYDADRDALQRIAAATRLLPAAITARIAEKALGPLLCARIAGLLAVDTAVEIAKRLPIPFLADVCLELDPRRAQAVIDRMPTSRVVEVSLEMARRDELVAMGRYVDILDSAALTAIIDQLHDHRALLQIAFFTEDRARLNSVIDRLPTPRYGAIIDAALSDDGALWPEALALIADLNPSCRRRFGEVALSRGADRIAQIIAISDAQRLWPALLPLADAVNDEQAVQCLHSVLRKQKPALLKRMLAAAAPHGSRMIERLAQRDWPPALQTTMTAAVRSAA